VFSLFVTLFSSDFHVSIRITQSAVPDFRHRGLLDWLARLVINIHDIGLALAMTLHRATFNRGDNY